MRRETPDYDEVYRTRTWAHGDKPDPELIRALQGLPRGRAVDLGGGQGRHALALSALGFNVVLVDSASEGLHQAAAAASERGLPLHTINSDVAKYQPDEGIVLCVAALLFHLTSHRAAIATAKRIGTALAPGGVMYASLPGYGREQKDLLSEVIEAAGLNQEWMVKHLVTKRERPRLQTARRNETRVLGRKPGDRRAGRRG